MGEVNSDFCDANSEFGCELKKIQKYAVERVSITVENQKVHALLKSNCEVPVIDKEWAAGLKSCFLVKEFRLEWGIIKIYQNQIPYQINGLLGNIFTTTGFNLILPWAIDINEDCGGEAEK